MSVVSLKVRPRWKRVLRIPRLLRQHYSITGDWRLALSLTWFAVTYSEPKK